MSKKLKGTPKKYPCVRIANQEILVGMWNGERKSSEEFHFLASVDFPTQTYSVFVNSKINPQVAIQMGKAGKMDEIGLRVFQVFGDGFREHYKEVERGIEQDICKILFSN